MFSFRAINPIGRKKQRGNNMIEFALLMPWYLFLFVGAIDYGFFSFGLIATQNAARVAALYCAGSSTAASDQDTACQYSLDQLRTMPNIGTAVTTCGAAPLVVTAAPVPGPDGQQAASVTVTYTTPQLIPIPGLLPGQLTISRTVKMRLRS
jgi:Flp pilus assembly protein TadG